MMHVIDLLTVGMWHGYILVQKYFFLADATPNIILAPISALFAIGNSPFPFLDIIYHSLINFTQKHTVLFARYFQATRAIRWPNYSVFFQS